MSSDPIPEAYRRLWAEINSSEFVFVPAVGYVKIASVEIDFNSLKRCNVQQPQEQELYDDVALDIRYQKSGQRLITLTAVRPSAL